MPAVRLKGVDHSTSVVRGVGILTASDPSGRLHGYQMSPGLHVRGDNVGKPEISRGTLAFRGGLGILRGFCYTLLVKIAAVIEIGRCKGAAT